MKINTDNEKGIFNINDTEVKCPHCEFNYNHIKAIHHTAEADEAENHGIDWKDRSHSAVQLDMSCEEGHSWKLIIVDRKGHTYIIRKK